MNLKKPLLVALILILFFTPFLYTGCSENKSVNLDGKKLLKEKCSSCHNLDMPPKTFKDEKAPPMMAVSFHIFDFIKAATPADRLPNAVEFVVDFTQNPNVSKSFCDKESLKTYGLMPSLKGKVSEDEVRAIANYVFTHYTKDNLLAEMKREQQIAKMPKGRLLAAKFSCLSCHARKFKKVGPSFNQIAKKLSKSQIENSIENGSKGKWKESNNIPMPAFKKISNKDINLIAKWIKIN
ncbi:MAG: c-type cytochrome [Campylobacteraceae bacterium]|nr:c-type cytochrome [Campylobacteraceae bacterium]